jgi:glycosyltransferase involved in cell wall biosynthesis
LAYTANLREKLSELFKKLIVRKVFDAPCSDFNCIYHVVRSSDIDYLGCDIVLRLIDLNNVQYQKNIRFIVGNIITDKFPNADLWICRDCLIHFSYNDILATFENFVRSDIDYLLTTTHINKNGFKNLDICTGDARATIARVYPFVVGCLARYKSRKGMDTLIRAMVTVCAKYPDARLVLAGSNPTGYADDLHPLADKFHVGHAVDVLDFCANPFTFLSQLDVFALASNSEGFGIVLLEAMATGLPVVASDIYPLNYIVVGGETGILANPAEPGALAATLIELLENPELAHRLGEAGRRRCLEEFSEGKMLQATANLYLDLTGRSRDVAIQCKK